MVGVARSHGMLCWQKVFLNPHLLRQKRAARERLNALRWMFRVSDAREVSKMLILLVDNQIVTLFYCQLIR